MGYLFGLLNQIRMNVRRLNVNQSHSFVVVEKANLD
jgi:hypothetical protein